MGVGNHRQLTGSRRGSLTVQVTLETVAVSSPVGLRVRRTWHLERVPLLGQFPLVSEVAGFSLSSYTRARDSLTGPIRRP
jgi:hypothetical protein